MANKTFSARIDSSEVTFFLKRLKFREQEELIGLIATISDVADPKAQASSVRQAIEICLAGWDKSDPITAWDTELDIVEAVKLIRSALAGNAASEDDKKKSE
jgi:hypothetical protein